MSSRAADGDERWSAAGPRVNACVRLVYRERWTRTLILSGDVRGVLRYEGMGYGERVYWNDVFRARASFWTWPPAIVAPRIEFVLPGKEGDLPALIEVAGTFAPWLFRITQFRFSVADDILYDEEGRDAWFAGGEGFVTDEPYEPDY
jgi:hypothetical protein